MARRSSCIRLSFVLLSLLSEVPQAKACMQPAEIQDFGKLVDQSFSELARQDTQFGKPALLDSLDGNITSTRLSKECFPLDTYQTVNSLFIGEECPETLAAGSNCLSFYEHSGITSLEASKESRTSLPMRGVLMNNFSRQEKEPNTVNFYSLKALRPRSQSLKASFCGVEFPKSDKQQLERLSSPESLGAAVPIGFTIDQSISVTKPQGSPKIHEKERALQSCKYGIDLNDRLVSQISYPLVEMAPTLDERPLSSVRLGEKILKDLKTLFIISELSTSRVMMEFWYFLNMNISNMDYQLAMNSGMNLKVAVETIASRLYPQDAQRDNARSTRLKMTSASMAFLGLAHIKSLEIGKYLNAFTLKVERVEIGETEIKELNLRLKTRGIYNIQELASFYQIMVAMAHLNLRLLDVYLKRTGKVLFNEKDTKEEQQIQERQLWNFATRLWKMLDNTIKAKDCPSGSKWEFESFDTIGIFLIRLQESRFESRRQLSLSWNLLEAWFDNSGFDRWKDLVDTTGKVRKNVKTFLNDLTLEFFLKKSDLFVNSKDMPRDKDKTDVVGENSALMGYDQNTSHLYRCSPNKESMRYLEFPQTSSEKQHTTENNSLWGRLGSEKTITTSIYSCVFDQKLKEELRIYIKFEENNLQSVFFWDFLRRRSTHGIGSFGGSHYKIPFLIKETYQKYHQMFQKDSQYFHNEMDVCYYGLALLGRSHMKNLEFAEEYENFVAGLQDSDFPSKAATIDDYRRDSKSKNFLSREEFFFWFQILSPVLHFQLHFLQEFFHKITGEYKTCDIVKDIDLWSWEKIIWGKIYNDSISHQKTQENYHSQAAALEIQGMTNSMIKIIKNKKNKSIKFKEITWFFLEFWLERKVNSDLKALLDGSGKLPRALKLYFSRSIYDFLTYGQAVKNVEHKRKATCESFIFGNKKFKTNNKM